MLGDSADGLFLLSLTASPAASEDLTDAMFLSELDTTHVLITGEDLL